MQRPNLASTPFQGKQPSFKLCCERGGTVAHELRCQQIVGWRADGSHCSLKRFRMRFTLVHRK